MYIECFGTYVEKTETDFGKVLVNISLIAGLSVLFGVIGGNCYYDWFIENTSFAAPQSFCVNFGLGFFALCIFMMFIHIMKYEICKYICLPLFRTFKGLFLRAWRNIPLLSNAYKAEYEILEQKNKILKNRIDLLKKYAENTEDETEKNNLLTLIRDMQQLSDRMTKETFETRKKYAILEAYRAVDDAYTQYERSIKSVEKMDANLLRSKIAHRVKNQVLSLR